MPENWKRVSGGFDETAEAYEWLAGPEPKGASVHPSKSKPPVAEAQHRGPSGSSEPSRNTLTCMIDPTSTDRSEP